MSITLLEPEIKVKYRIVHQIPGRLRLRIPLLAKDRSFAERLHNLLSAANFVKAVRLNQEAASIAISYQKQEKSAELYIIQLIEQAEEQKTKPLPPAKESESLDISELKLPALATFLAIAKEHLRLPIPQPLLAVAVIAASFPVAKRATESLINQRKLNIDCLDIMAVTFSSLQGRWLTPTLLLLLHEIGDVIRDRTARSSAHQTTDLLDTLGHFAWVERNGSKQQIPLTEVQLHETVIVYPGEQIPVDGSIIKGEALIDEQKLTGESLPVMRHTGEMVYASTLVREGEIYIKTERLGSQTRAGMSIELVKQAPVHDTRMENYAAKIADLAVVPALVLASVIFMVTRNPSRAASILTLDFVTGVRVSLPTTFLAAINHAARHGVLIRSGRALEKLAQVDTLVFDKTGTLTQGDLQVIGVETVKGRLSALEVLQLAAGAEQRLTHPKAEAVMEYAESQNIIIPPRDEWNYELGLGVQAQIQGKTVRVGSDRFLEENGISLDCFYEQHPCLKIGCGKHSNCPISADASLIYVACDGQFQGAIQYSDPLRKESPSVIAKLQQVYGYDIHLLTGDNIIRATAVASALAIPTENIHAQAFPSQKAEIVNQLHNSGKTVAFIGDGLNDSVALAYADVSISFANGSEIARETADVVLMNDNLNGLLEAIAIAIETRQLIKQNIGLSVIPNLAALLSASTVGLHPLIATLVHNGSAIAAGLNGLRPLMHRHNQTPQGE